MRSSNLKASARGASASTVQYFFPVFQLGRPGPTIERNSSKRANPSGAPGSPTTQRLSKLWSRPIPSSSAPVKKSGRTKPTSSNPPPSSTPQEES